MNAKRSPAAAILIALSLCCSVQADVLKTRDGRTFEGVVVSEESGQIVFEAHKYGSKVILRIRRSNVSSLEKREFTPTAPQPAQAEPSHADDGMDLPPEPPAPPIQTKVGPTYCVIPLVGDVGKEVCAEVLAKSLDDAAARKATVAVLLVESNGGHVREVEGLVAAIRGHKDRIRIVALVRRALSAAAITSLACPEIYVEPQAVFGAATAFRMTPDGTPEDIQEKMQSVWRAMARSSAEAGGHNPLLAEAMIDAAVELHTTTSGGKPEVARGPGDGSITRKGRLLALTAKEAVACGLSAGVVEDLQGLGAALGLPKWTELDARARLLAEHRKKVIEKVEELNEQYHKDFGEAMELAERSAPWHGRYSYYRDTGRFTRDSWARWNSRSRTCILHLGRAKEVLQKAAKLAEKFPYLVGDPKMLRTMEEQVQAAQTRLAKESHKRGVYD